MKLAVWTNFYECPYFDDWKRGIAKQVDMDFVIYSSVQHACDNSDAVLCLDIDDIPSSMIVKIAKQVALDYDVTAFGARIINEKGRAIGRFGLGGLDIYKYNVFGFTNTVYRSEVLSKLLPIRDVLIPDWDTARRAFEMGASMHFDDRVLTSYRQYGQESNQRLVEIDGRYVWCL